MTDFLAVAVLFFMFLFGLIFITIQPRVEPVKTMSEEQYKALPRCQDLEETVGEIEPWKI